MGELVVGLLLGDGVLHGVVVVARRLRLVLLVDVRVAVDGAVAMQVGVVNRALGDLVRVVAGRCREKRSGSAKNSGAASWYSVPVFIG